MNIKKIFSCLFAAISLFSSFPAADPPPILQFLFQTPFPIPFQIPKRLLTSSPIRIPLATGVKHSQKHACGTECRRGNVQFVDIRKHIPFPPRDTCFQTGYAALAERRNRQTDSYMKFRRTVLTTFAQE